MEDSTGSDGLPVTLRTSFGRNIARPAHLAIDDLFELGSKLEALLSVDAKEISDADIRTMQSMRRQHLREANELCDRLQKVGSKQESDEIHSHKVLMQCECFRKISKINRVREDMNEDLLSNTTPDNMSLFSESAGIGNKLRGYTSFVMAVTETEQVSSSEAVPHLTRGAEACGEIVCSLPSTWGNTGNLAVAVSEPPRGMVNWSTLFPRVTHSVSSRDVPLQGAPLQSAPLHSAPLHSAPLHSAPLHSAPLHSAPLHSAPLHSAPLHSAPLHSAPLHSAPLHSVPLHSAPLHSAPLHSAPLHSAPLHSAPLHSAPLHSAPLHSAPLHSAPLHSAPLHSAPLHSAPLHSAPLHSAPLHSAPLHSAPLHSAPLHSAPLHSAPLHSAPLNSAPFHRARPRQFSEAMVGSGMVQLGQPDVAANYLLKQQLFHIPKSPYSGSADNYKTWSSLLKTRMQDVVLSPFEKLQIMMCHTSGAPHSIIQDYVEASSYDISDATVDLVWNILNERYGSAILSSRYIDRRVEDLAPLRDSEQREELGRLIDLCRLIHLKVQHYPELAKYNESEGMQRLWMKLPEKLRLRWRSYGIKSKINNGGRNPSLGVFVGFLQEVYSEISDDFFGETIVDHKIRRSVKVLHSQVAESMQESSRSSVSGRELEDHVPRPPIEFSLCPLHESGKHKLSSCRKFISMSSQERKNLIWSHGLCFRCLGDHVARNCPSHNKCDECGNNHLTILHDDNSNKRNKSGQLKALCSQVRRVADKICSKTVLVYIKHPTSDKIVTGYAILDEQSSTSFIDPSVLDLLDLQGIPQTYSLRTLSGLETDVPGVSIDELHVCGIHRSVWYKIPRVFTNPFIPDSRDEVATSDIVGMHPHLVQFKGKFPDCARAAPVLLLIGADSGEIMRTKCYGTHPPFVHETPLGWALVGSASVSDSSNSSMKVLRTKICSPQADVFKEYGDDENVDLSQDEKLFMETMREHVRVVDGHLVMPLPFRRANVTMPDNRIPVFHRTKLALERLKRSPEKLDQCLNSMKQNLEKQHIERIPDSEVIPRECGKAWYLPLFPVTQAKKKKTRLVFDAAACFKGTCLNKELMTGPHMTNQLRAVLLRFRRGLIGLTCDVEHMFYNFYLDESMKDYLRFFWFDSNDPDKILVPYRARVHIFGASSSPAVASFGLRYAALNSSLPDVEKAVEFVLHSFYVDDGVTSVDAVEDGVKLLMSTKRLLTEFGINVHKFSASDSRVLRSFSPDDVANNRKQMDFDDSLPQRTLGVVWDLASDSFVAIADVPEAPFTRRGVLSVVNSYFDPIGVAAPVILTGRLIQRRAFLSMDVAGGCSRRVDYDCPLPSAYLPMWNDWRLSLKQAHLLSIPRCFVSADFGEVVQRTLHVFTDASIEAIGAVIYLVSFNILRETKVAFVTSMSRVAPRAATSVPRLELCAALQGSILACDVIREKNFELESVTYHTDSKVVLGYLNNSTRRFSRYVTRRVESINKVAPAALWQYVPSEDNPADIATRPSDPLSLSRSRWFMGPEFIKCSEPRSFECGVFSEMELPEEVKEKVSQRTAALAIERSPLTDAAERTSSWLFLVKVTNLIMSFIERCFRNIDRNPISIEINPIDRLLIVAQRESYPEAFDLLVNGSCIPDNHCIGNLSPFLDSIGLIRVGGRLKNATPFDVAHPVFVPAKHPISSLLIRHLHHSIGHQGRHVTHGCIREKGYHLENGRRILRELLKDCVTCRRLRGKPCEQLMADLPCDRLERTPPFTNVGLDVFGPLLVLDGVNTRRRSATKKMYVLLLTCLVTRGVHLEPLSSMDTPSFVNGLRRFFALRGTCKRIRSDHGSNFIGAINQAQTHVDFGVVRSVAASHQCEWLLNPPASSHFGGAWERKIGSVRRVLEGTLQQTRGSSLSRDEMVTLLQEAAAIVNSTPLYCVSPDPNDGAPITPNCLMTLKDDPNPPPLEKFTEEDILQYGRRRWRRVQYLADQFWIRWRSQYLQTLSQRRKWKKPKRNIEQGDIVLLRVKNTPRNRWPTGIVSEVKLSEDKMVRSVKLRIGDKIYERPIHELVLLIGID